MRGLYRPRWRSLIYQNFTAVNMFVLSAATTETGSIQTECLTLLALSYLKNL